MPKYPRLPRSVYVHTGLVFETVGTVKRSRYTGTCRGWRPWNRIWIWMCLSFLFRCTGRFDWTTSARPLPCGCVFNGWSQEPMFPQQTFNNTVLFASVFVKAVYTGRQLSLFQMGIFSRLLSSISPWSSKVLDIGWSIKYTWALNYIKFITMRFCIFSINLNLLVTEEMRISILSQGNDGHDFTEKYMTNINWYIVLDEP